MLIENQKPQNISCMDSNCRKIFPDKIQNMQMGIYTHELHIQTCTTHTYMHNTQVHTAHTLKTEKEKQRAHFFPMSLFPFPVYLIPVSISFLITCCNSSVTRPPSLLPSGSHLTLYNAARIIFINNQVKDIFIIF